MRTAANILDDLQRAGADMVLEFDRTFIRGNKISDALLKEVKENKAALIEEVKRRKELDLDRYGRVPPATAPMLGGDYPLPNRLREPVMEYVFRQPRPVHAWVTLRAAEYHKQHLPFSMQEVAACIDVLSWQRGGIPRAALEWFEGIEECDNQKLK